MSAIDHYKKFRDKASGIDVDDEEPIGVDEDLIAEKNDPDYDGSNDGDGGW
jgi:hypothetical protein